MILISLDCFLSNSNFKKLALMATMTVLKLIKIAPAAGLCKSLPIDIIINQHLLVKCQ
jgi:hypothetical protein